MLDSSLDSTTVDLDKALEVVAGWLKQSWENLNPVKTQVLNLGYGRTGLCVSCTNREDEKLRCAYGCAFVYLLILYGVLILCLLCMERSAYCLWKPKLP